MPPPLLETWERVGVDLRRPTRTRARCTTAWGASTIPPGTSLVTETPSSGCTLCGWHSTTTAGPIRCLALPQCSSKCLLSAARHPAADHQRPDRCWCEHAQAPMAGRGGMALPRPLSSWLRRWPASGSSRQASQPHCQHCAGPWEVPAASQDC
ncbi:hypothetical protein COO60DRAFT_555239 [Scenedesmus sp. NREL 46B-D3]|nr:hypothetical protein COO60DRAFT_555239 [Scenedesmus sp. NREL 46B-D3]